MTTLSLKDAGYTARDPLFQNLTFTLGPGDLIRPEALARSRDHLSETRVFRSVDIRSETTHLSRSRLD